MSDAELLRDGIRYSAVRLNRHHRIVRQERFGFTLVEMRDKFLERFHADTARVAMLEEQHRPRVGFGKEAVELVNMLERSEIRMHEGIQCSSRDKCGPSYAH